MVYPIIKPKIDLEKKPIRNLSKDSRAAICKCEEPCKYYVLIDDYGRFCEKDAREIALSIYSIVEGLHRLESTNTKHGWSVKEEQYIIDWFTNNERCYGEIRIIASMLNRPYERTKAKIKQMRRTGRL